MAGIDLSGVARALDDWLVDDLTVERDNGVGDDTLNEETGRLESPTPDRLYTGKGGVQPISPGDGVTDPDVARYYEEAGARYRALLPLAASAGVTFRAGDVLRVVAVHGVSSDPALAGRRFELVDQPTVSSFSVARLLYLKPV